jgi:hypothetical protein
MPSQAAGAFGLSISYVEQLIRAHSRLQAGRGRRFEQEAIHRAGIVLTVGAWEGYVELVTMEALRVIETSAGAYSPPSWARHAFSLFRIRITAEVHQFNTPNAQNVRRLFQNCLGFDPWPFWSWRRSSTNRTRNRLDDWLRIRHGIAHGSGLPINIPWIHGPNQHPRLNLDLLWDCKEFVERLVARTDDAIRDFLVHRHGVADPW